MAVGREDVSFPTMDGLVLRGWLYPAPSQGAGIIITPGLPCVKEMIVAQIGEAFQRAGITALVYDPRSLGDSDGEPRSEIDPLLQVSDLSDALSFLVAQANVDRERVALWGMSFSATVALCAAALDRRAKLCIAACPFLDHKPPADRVARVLEMCMQDRESRRAGNPPTYLPMLTRAGVNPAGLPIRPTPEELEHVLLAQERGAPNFRNRCTLETYYNFQRWDAYSFIPLLVASPVLVLVPERDTWSAPDTQRALFEQIASPKELHIIPGKGHLTLFDSATFEEVMQLQVDFLRRGFAGEI